jgi:hypothetical protein
MTGSGTAQRRPAHRFGHGVGWLLLLWGAMALVSATRSLGRTARCTAEPHELTLRQFLDGGAGANAHVAITGFRLCDRYLTENFKGGQGRRWVSYIGIVPATADPSSPPRLLVKPRDAWEEQHLLREWGHREMLAGIVERASREWEGDQRRLREVYPGIDLSSCVVLEEGQRPQTAEANWAWLGAGIGGVALGGLLLAPRRAVRLWGRWGAVKTG